jgi:hypothetical protein
MSSFPSTRAMGAPLFADASTAALAIGVKAVGSGSIR